jgi:hypothetical protein
VALEQVFEVFSGNDVTLRFTVTENDSGEALDLTGAQALIWALAKNANAQAIVTKTLGAGVTITDPANGVVEVVLTDDDLEPLRGTYYHEMRLTNSSGLKSTLVYGVATVVGNLIKS